MHTLVGEIKIDSIFVMTLPSKLRTYLSSGIPWVAMPNEECADFVREAGPGFTCQAANHAGLTSAVLQLSKTTPHECRRMGGKDRELSQRVFNQGTLTSHLDGWIGESCSGTAMSNEHRSRT
jgi:hypothetical protein